MAYGLINADVIGTSVAGSNLGAGNASTLKNRLINGGMVIDQRNAGSSVTPTAIGSATYLIDRWASYTSQASKFSAQQNAGSVTPPAGFTNYLGITSLSAYSVGSTDYFMLSQAIEGFNTADLAWGTANAKTVTLSFQVYSSLTGTFGGVLTNNAQNRTYPFTYTISSANTWTSISVTIAGDTTGTWLTNNSKGIWVVFGLGCGSSQSATAGAWGSTSALSATGATSVVGTSGATFYITGVQLEVGSSATGFEYRQYGTELALCQRYYEQSYAQGTAVGTNTSTGTYQLNAASDGSSNFGAQVLYKVTKRNNATVTAYLTSGTSGSWNYGRSGASSTATVTPANYSDTGFLAVVPVGAAWTACQAYGHWTANSEL